MKEIRLDLFGYLKKMQYCFDEGFTIENDSNVKTLSVGIYVKEMDTRFWCQISQFKKFAMNKKKIDIKQYHGATKNMVTMINQIIEDYVPPKIPNVITKIVDKG